MSQPALMAHLQQLERRERWVRTIRYGGAAAILGAGAGPVIYLVTQSWVFAASAFLTAIGCAVVVAVTHTSPLRAIAATVDRALALQDRVVTAVQHHQDDDVFSRLVVADAERRIENLDAAAVFPLRPPPHAGRLAIAAAVVATLTIAASVQYGLESVVNRAEVPRGPGDGEASAPQDERGSSDPARKQDASTARQRANAQPGTTPPPGAQPAPADTRVASTTADPSSRPATPEPPAMPTPATPSSVETDAGARDKAAVNSGGRSGRLNSRGGAGIATSVDRRRAGGISADAPLSTGTDSAASRRPQALAVAAAADRAEAAMSRPDVPPALNAYVRAYFESIRR